MTEPILETVKSAADELKLTKTQLLSLQKKIGELDIRKKYQLNIVAFRMDKELVLPTPTMRMHAGDTAFVIGSLRDIQKCFKL